MRVSGERRFPAALAAGILFIAALMSVLAVVRWNVWSYGTDTGTFAQIALNAFHGFTDGPEHGTHFIFHWSPILVLLYPFVALTHSPLAIQFVEIAAIVLTAIPLYALMRSYAGEQWAWRCALLTLIYPPLLSIAFEEFHELALYPVIAVGLMWAADRARWLWYALFAVLIVLVREDVSVDAIFIGIVFGIFGLVARSAATRPARGLLAGEPIEPKRLVLAGFGLALLAATSLAIYFGVMIPHMGRWLPQHFYNYSFAHGPEQTALSVFTHPVALAAAVFTMGRFTYLLEAFAPLAFLPLYTRWSGLAIPGFLGVLAASDPIVWRMGFHYSLLWTPWLLIAAAWVLCRLAGGGRERTARRWWGAAIAVCAIVLAAFDPMHPAHYLRSSQPAQPADVSRALSCIPSDAPLMTHDEWFAHIAAAYPNSTNLDENAARFRGYVMYAPDWQNAHVRSAILPPLDRALSQGRFRLVCRYGSVLVLRATLYRTSE